MDDGKVSAGVIRDRERIERYLRMTQRDIVRVFEESELRGEQNGAPLCNQFLHDTFAVRGCRDVFLDHDFNAKLFLNKFTKLHEIQVEAIVVFCSAQDNAKLLCPRTGLDVARLFRLRLGGVCLFLRCSRLCACHQRCREQNQHQHHCNYFFHCFSSVLFL